MIARASGLGMGVGRCSRPQGGVRVPGMHDAGLHTTLQVQSACEVSPGAGMLRLIDPGVAVGVFINRLCVADMVEVTR